MDRLGRSIPKQVISLLAEYGHSNEPSLIEQIVAFGEVNGLHSGLSLALEDVNFDDQFAVFRAIVRMEKWQHDHRKKWEFSSFTAMHSLNETERESHFTQEQRDHFEMLQRAMRSVSHLLQDSSIRPRTDWFYGSVCQTMHMVGRLVHMCEDTNNSVAFECLGNFLKEHRGHNSYLDKYTPSRVLPEDLRFTVEKERNAYIERETARKLAHEKRQARDKIAALNQRKHDVLLRKQSIIRTIESDRVRETRLKELSSLDPVERLTQITASNDVTLAFFPKEWGEVDSATLSALPRAQLLKLAERCKQKSAKSWRANGARFRAFIANEEGDDC